MEQTDFGPVDGFSPVDPPVLLGLDPLLLVALILLLLAVAAGMYLLGRRRMGETGETDAEDIHAAILKVSAAAMSARSDELLSKAEALRRVVDDRLGAVLTIGEGVGEPIGKLHKALRGKGPARPEPGKTGTTAPVAIGAMGRPVTINQVYIGAAPVTGDDHGHETHGHGADQGHGHGHDDHGHGHGERELTTREQIDEISRAVRDFHDYWSHKRQRIDELRAAHRALSRR